MLSPIIWNFPILRRSGYFWLYIDPWNLFEPRYLSVFEKRIFTSFIRHPNYPHNFIVWNLEWRIITMLCWWLAEFVMQSKLKYERIEGKHSGLFCTVSYKIFEAYKIGHVNCSVTPLYVFLSVSMAGFLLLFVYSSVCESGWERSLSVVCRLSVCLSFSIEV